MWDRVIMATLALAMPAFSSDDREWRAQLELGWEQKASGDIPTARIHFEEAFSIAEKEFGVEDGRLAYSAVQLGDVLVLQKRWTKARRLYEFAGPIYEVAGNDWKSELAYCQKQVADCDYVERQYAKAEAGYIRSLQTYEAAGESESEKIVYPLFGLGRTYRASGKLDAAEKVLRLAAERADRLERKPSNLGTIVAELAEVARLRGDASEAESLLDKAYKQSVLSHGENHIDVLEILEAQAKLLRSTGRLGQARQVEVKAADIRRRLNPS